MSDEKVIEMDTELDEEKQKLINAIEELDNSELEETDKYVMRELLSGKDKDILFKTELNFNQIKALVRLLTMDRIMKAQSIQDKEKKQKVLESVPNHMSMLLMKLLVSKERKGREEFITAWIGNVQERIDDIKKKWLNW